MPALVLPSPPTDLRWCWGCSNFSEEGLEWGWDLSLKIPAKKNPRLESRQMRKPWCRKIMSCTSSFIAGLHPNTKLGYQIWSYPDLSFPIWKPVIFPESLDFEDWLLLILLQANSPSWPSVNNKQLLDSLLSPDASPDSSIHRGSRSINQSCSQILKYHHLKTHPAFSLAEKAARTERFPQNSMVAYY